MSGSPDWKVYDAGGAYQAAAKDASLAAAIVSVLGEGATVRYRHSRIVWREGVDGSAFDSYDAAAETMHARRMQSRRRR